MGTLTHTDSTIAFNRLGISKSVPRTHIAPVVKQSRTRKRVMLAMEWLDYELNLGIAEYASKAGWIIDDAITHSGKPPASFAGDGIIALLRIDDSDITRFVRKTKVPIVDMVNELPALKVSRVLADNVAIGRVAADHLLACGLHHLGFLNIWDSEVEQERMSGFAAAIAEAGRTFYPLQYHGKKRDSSDPQHLFHWLKDELLKLPTPLGMMGHCDREAMYIVQACEMAGLRVPEQVAIVGSDNDPILCELGQVQLSSVDNRRRDQGYAAAQLLDKLMSGDAAPKDIIRVPTGPVIVRHSSEMLAVPDADLSKALKFIAEHYREPISVQEVVRHVDTTRRRLYMLFEQHLGRPIHAEILRRRLELARRLLATTTNKLYAIARACGFQDAQQLTRVFTREVGIPPSRYRQRQGRDVDAAGAGAAVGTNGAKSSLPS